MLQKWGAGWKEKGWKKKSGEIKNLDIVKELYELYINSQVSLYWTKGHVGTKYNEMADEWANRARVGATIEKL